MQQIPPKTTRSTAAYAEATKASTAQFPSTSKGIHGRKQTFILSYILQGHSIFLCISSPPPPFFSPKKTNKDNDSFNKKNLTKTKKKYRETKKTPIKLTRSPSVRSCRSYIEGALTGAREKHR